MRLRPPCGDSGYGSDRCRTFSAIASSWHAQNECQRELTRLESFAAVWARLTACTRCDCYCPWSRLRQKRTAWYSPSLISVGAEVCQLCNSTSNVAYSWRLLSPDSGSESRVAAVTSATMAETEPCWSTLFAASKVVFLEPWPLPRSDSCIVRFGMIWASLACSCSALGPRKTIQCWSWPWSRMRRAGQPVNSWSFTKLPTGWYREHSKLRQCSNWIMLTG